MASAICADHDVPGLRSSLSNQTLRPAALRVGRVFQPALQLTRRLGVGAGMAEKDERRGHARRPVSRRRGGAPRPRLRLRLAREHGARTTRIGPWGCRGLLSNADATFPPHKNSSFQSFSKVPRANGRGKAGARSSRSLRERGRPLRKGNGRFGATPRLIFRKRDNLLHRLARCSIYVPNDQGERRVSGSAEAAFQSNRPPRPFIDRSASGRSGHAFHESPRP